jgi:hypothetical protein
MVTFWTNTLLLKGVRIMMFNATFNNISAISWRSLLLVKETEVPRENLSQVTDFITCCIEYTCQLLLLAHTTKLSQFPLEFDEANDCKHHYVFYVHNSCRGHRGSDRSVVGVIYFVCSAIWDERYNYSFCLYNWYKYCLKFLFIITFRGRGTTTP